MIIHVQVYLSVMYVMRLDVVARVESFNIDIALSYRFYIHFSIYLVRIALSKPCALIRLSIMQHFILDWHGCVLTIRKEFGQGRVWLSLCSRCHCVLF